jgi:hypothetical protein
MELENGNLQTSDDDRYEGRDGDLADAVEEAEALEAGSGSMPNVED